jgi:hypothetical protein
LSQEPCLGVTGQFGSHAAQAVASWLQITANGRQLGGASWFRTMLLTYNDAVPSGRSYECAL